MAENSQYNKLYYDSCITVKKAISIRKAELMEQNVIHCEGDQKKLFSLIHSLFGSKKITVLPEYTSSFTLASSINMFFIEKIHIKMEFPLLDLFPIIEHFTHCCNVYVLTLFGNRYQSEQLGE